MDTIEYEIRECYNKMNQKLSSPSLFSNGKYFDALSQYGYCLQDGFSSELDAEQFVINYYRDRMNLIRQ